MRYFYYPGLHSETSNFRRTLQFFFFFFYAEPVFVGSAAAIDHSLQEISFSVLSKSFSENKNFFNLISGVKVTYFSGEIKEKRKPFLFNFYSLVFVPLKRGRGGRGGIGIG